MSEVQRDPDFIDDMADADMYNKFAVDLPDGNNYGPEVEWRNLATFPTREEAIEWAKENLGADDNGMLCVVAAL